MSENAPKPPENAPPAPPTAPEWTPPTREEWEAVQGLRGELDALKAKQTAADEAARVANGEAAALLEERSKELAAAQERIAAFEASEAKRVKALEATNRQRIEQIPESLRGLVPTNYDAPALAAWLDANRESLRIASERPGGSGPRGGSVDYPAAMIREAKQQGFTSPAQLAWYHSGPWQRRTNPHRNAEA